MGQFLAFGIVGLSTAAIYAVIGSGLVLTYTTTGVFNFAHGAAGMLAAFTYWQLTSAAHVLRQRRADPHRGGHDYLASGSVAMFTEAVADFLSKDVGVVRKVAAELGADLGSLGDLMPGGR